jgi:dTDP-4-amino-4,6-dideoxygalactose transaminase
MTTGEGGMATASVELIDKMRTLALHGMTRNAWNRFAKGGSWKYDVEIPGYKYNLTDIASAMGIVQLKRLEELYASRMKIVNRYNEAFRGSEFIRVPKVRAGVQSAHHLYIILLELDRLKIDRDQFISELTERNIGTSVHYTPIHMLSYYAKKYGWKPESFPHAHRAFQSMISIPLSSKMSVKDADDVINAVDDVIKSNLR